MTKMRTLRLREGEPTSSRWQAMAPEPTLSFTSLVAEQNCPWSGKEACSAGMGPSLWKGNQRAGVGGERVVGTESRSTRRDRDAGTPKIFP